MCSGRLGRHKGVWQDEVEANAWNALPQEKLEKATSLAFATATAEGRFHGLAARLLEVTFRASSIHEGNASDWGTSSALPIIFST
eukprot:4110930-Amphidinium_carterae.1